MVDRTSHRRILVGAVVACVAMTAASVQAQSLIWSVPEQDGTYVQYEGSYKNVQRRPENALGDLSREWRCELTIKAVGTETADVDGQEQKCRWLEIKSVVGTPSEQGVKPGPSGERIYKVLVPQSKVLGKVHDQDDIQVTFLPVVKGYRRIGNRDPEPLKEKVLAVSPMLTLLEYYDDLKAESAAEDVTLPGAIGDVKATLWKGSQTKESSTHRSTNQGQIWVSPQIPFGVARWKVVLKQETKDATEKRDQFKDWAEITVEMSAIKQGTDGRSDLAELK
jgi:hypothetical protein